MSAGDGSGVSSTETGAVAQKNEVAPKQPTQAELRKQAIQKGLDQRAEMEARQDAISMRSIVDNRNPSDPQKDLHDLANKTSYQLAQEATELTKRQSESVDQPASAGGSSGVPPEVSAAAPSPEDENSGEQPSAGEPQTSTPGKSPEEQEQENPFKVTDADGNPVDAHGRVTRDTGIPESSTETASSPSGESPENTQAASVMTPPPSTEVPKDEEVQLGKEIVEARKENNQVNTGVANIMQNADEALMSENPQYQELKEKQKQVPKDSKEWAALQKQIDEMQRQKAKEIALTNNDIQEATKVSKEAMYDAVHTAGEIVAPEKGLLWRMIRGPQGLMSRYEKATDKAPIVAAGERARKSMSAYWQKRKVWQEMVKEGRREEAQNEKSAIMATIRHDLGDFAKLRFKKFLLKDWPLLSLGMLLLFWLGITYGLHKLSGGK